MVDRYGFTLRDGIAVKLDYGQWVSFVDYEALEAKLARLVEVSESIYNSHLRCDTPIKEHIITTKYKEEWKLYDCGKCPVCQLKAAIAATQGRE